MEVSSSTGRIVAAVGVVVALGLAAGYGVATRGRPEPVRLVQASPTPDPAASDREVFVHVAGAVAVPGLYELREGDRVADALRAAGGAGADADLDAINLAAPVRDGDKIAVPRQGESPSTGAGGGGTTSDGRVDLNRATEAELQTLPGIGPALAQRIIAYREQHGGFRTVKDLMKVPGIGPRKFEQLEPLVVV